MRYGLSVFALCAFLVTLPALAHEDNLPPLKPGETIVNLSATEREKMEQDLLVANLRVEMKGKDSKEIQNQVNSAMSQAVTEAKKIKTVKTSTGSYYVHPFYPNPQYTKEREWQASQTIRLESKSADDLLKLAGKIQEMGFLMNGLEYSLSIEKAEEVQDVLMQRALKQLMARAQLAAESLGKKTVELQEAHINGQIPYQPMMMARGMVAMDSAEMKAPVAEAGESEVTLSVTARILLKP